MYWLSLGLRVRTATVLFHDGTGFDDHHSEGVTRVLRLKQKVSSLAVANRATKKGSDTGEVSRRSLAAEKHKIAAQ